MTKKQQQPSEPYLIIPIVPQAFEAAAAVNIDARNAIQYWKEQRQGAWYNSERQFFLQRKAESVAGGERASASGDAILSAQVTLRNEGRWTSFARKRVGLS